LAVVVVEEQQVEAVVWPVLLVFLALAHLKTLHVSNPIVVVFVVVFEQELELSLVRKAEEILEEGDLHLLHKGVISVRETSYCALHTKHAFLQEIHQMVRTNSEFS
jgi:hypothetical protein